MDAAKSAPSGLDEETKEKLKKEHGELLAVQSKSGTLVFKSPSEPVFGQFTAAVSKENANPLDAMMVYCLNCAVYPSREAVAVAFTAQPGLPTTIANHLNEMAGAGSSVEVSKL